MATIWQSSAFWLMTGAFLLFLVGLFVLLTTQSAPTQSKSTPTRASTPSILATWTPHPSVTGTNPLNLIWGNPIRYEEPPPISPIEPRLQAIEVERPSCYGLANAMYSCLGRVWNRSDEAIGDTAFDFVFYNDTQQATLRNSVTLEQRLIMPNDFAPYRAILPQDFDDLEALSAYTAVEVLHVFEPLSTLTDLTVTSSNSYLSDNGLYTVSMTVDNVSDEAVQSVRIITTISSSEWGIVGYDAHEVEDMLQSKSELALDVSIIPHVLVSPLYYESHVEAIILDD